MFTGSLRSGSKSGTSVNCRKCRGSGIQVIHRPIGPGMVQQMRGPCTDCDGTGKLLGTRGHTIKIMCSNNILCGNLTFALFHLSFKYIITPLFTIIPHNNDNAGNQNPPQTHAIHCFVPLTVWQWWWNCYMSRIMIGWGHICVCMWLKVV